VPETVDLTYRGLPLGRLPALTQLRPSSCLVELATPMPVGSHLAIVTDDGLAIDATVVWVHEQVGGVERAAAMVLSPALTAEAAAAWWRARVTLPDESWATPRPRSRSVTVRPRSHTQPTPPPDGATTDEVPTIIADLDARVTAAAGLPPRRAATTSTPPLDPGQVTGDFAIVDDGRRTITMPILDTTEQDLAPVPAPAGQVAAGVDPQGEITAATPAPVADGGRGT
jgi:hypothetical protein